MKTDIILIGPIGTGKSTLGKLLAEKLDLPQCSMDEVRWSYYKEIGYDETEQRRIAEAEGFPGVYRYWKPFEAHAVERLLSEHHDCVVDFGAGHSVYDGDLFDRVQKALLPYQNVVLILPSPDLDLSVRILKERGWDGLADEFDFHEYFVKHPSNRRLAKHVVYTKDKSPEETCADILELITSTPSTSQKPPDPTGRPPGAASPSS